MKVVETPTLPIYLGCPVFSCPAWNGSVYPRGTAPTKRLHWYSRMFNTVEGNSTFYGLPTPETVDRWCSDAAAGFRFCLKFPRSISHEHQLTGCQSELAAFLAVVQRLAEAQRLGPTFLQLGPHFSPAYFAVLRGFLKDLPVELPWAVEVRHLDWFDQTRHEQALNEMLTQMQIDKVLFDSRPLYQAPPNDPIEATSQTRKPKTPVRQTVTGKHPMLRLVGRNRLELTESFIDQWVPIVTHWIHNDLEPYVFTHAPDDRFAPEFARRFWLKLCEELQSKTLDSKSLKPWSADDLPKLPAPPEQTSFL